MINKPHTKVKFPPTQLWFQAHGTSKINAWAKEYSYEPSILLRLQLKVNKSKKSVLGGNQITPFGMDIHTAKQKNTMLITAQHYDHQSKRLTLKGVIKNQLTCLTPEGKHSAI